MDLLNHILKSAPEIALFVALALGHALGRVKLGSFSLGGVAGSLIVALFIGQFGVTLPDALKAVCFALFIYSVGFKSGPEFFGGLNRSSLRLDLPRGKEGASPSTPRSYRVGIDGVFQMHSFLPFT